MANNVIAVQVGGQPKQFENVTTVREVAAQLGLDNPSVKINGNEASLDSTLSDFAYITFGAKVKGACELLPHWSHV